MVETTVIYYTDNSLDEMILNLCQRYLVRAVGDNPILSVSQKPMAFGLNICVGEIGRSILSIFQQQVTGLEAVRTKYVAFAEHDVIYSPEHFAFIPPRDDIFYYNTNLWYLQYGGYYPELTGMFSYIPRRQPYREFVSPQSQLIANRELVLRAYKERMSFVEKGWLSRALPAEPGVKKISSVIKLKELLGRSIGEARRMYETLIEWVNKWTAKHFVTVIPNLDIRHNTNISRGKRDKVGKKRCYELPYWGTLKDIMEYKCLTEQ